MGTKWEWPAGVFSITSKGAGPSLESLGRKWRQQRVEERLMSEVSHVQGCFCPATMQGHTHTQTLVCAYV